MFSSLAVHIYRASYRSVPSGSERCQALRLIISVCRQFPQERGAPVAGSLIYIKTRGMVGYTVSGWISPM